MSPWCTLATFPLFQVIVTASQLVSVTMPLSAASPRRVAVGSCADDRLSGRIAGGARSILDTLLLHGAVNTINATLYDKLNFNFIRDIAPVAGISRYANLMEVNPSFPAETVPEFIAYAKANPGKINMASGGNGTSQHLSGELFRMMTGVNMLHVPYRGAAPALTDLLGGQVQVMFDAMVSSIEYIRAGPFDCRSSFSGF
jgi:tripartite-type tricarboxylate transporter receptor subunit TctC